MEDPVGSTQTHQLRVFDPRSGPSANRVNVRVIFAASCQPENPCANKVPHRSSNRFYQWPFGKWRIHSDPSQRGSNEGPAFCALKYRLIAPGFWWRFCEISCVYLSLPTNVIGPPNIFEISNFAIRIRWFFFFSFQLFLPIIIDKHHSFQEYIFCPSLAFYSLIFEYKIVCLMYLDVYN